MEPLTVPARLEALTQLLDYVAWAAAAAGLDDQALYRLSLAVDEIATNIVTYGYEEGASAAGDRDGDLLIWSEVDEGRLIIHLQDRGQPFDPRQFPPPDDLLAPGDRREAGGLGIFLALWGVDDFEYDRIEDDRGGVNHSRFIMALPQN